MSVFIKRPRGTSAKDKLCRELQNTVYAGKILGDMVPDIALGAGKDELEFGYLGPRNEFLDKRLTENNDSISDALVEVADALATLHSRSSDVKATPDLIPSKFADELLEVYGLATSFLEAYIEIVDGTINYRLLDCLFKEKIRCRTILALHMFGERSLQFRLLESVYKKLVVSDIVSVVDFARKG